MKLTKAQDELLQELENGSLVVYKDGHYVVSGMLGERKIWPSTFYGLFENDFVEVVGDRNYMISANGIEQIRSKNQ